MNYLTVNEILLSVKGLALSEVLTEEQIQLMIDDETAMVNGQLSHRYVMPIDSEDEKVKNAFNIVKGIVRYRVLCRLELFLKISGNQSKDSQAIIDKMKVGSLYKEAIEKILDGRITLDGVDIVDNVVAYDFKETRYSEEFLNW